MRNTNPVTRFYEVKPGKSGWSRIWLTDDGCISIMSDWGNYGYWFGAPECEFRLFLTHCDDDYLGNKFAGGQRVFDGEATADNVREFILKRRREKRMSAEDARWEWNGLQSDGFDNEVDYADWIGHRTEIKDPYDHEFSCYVRPHAVGHFLKHVWPLFVEQLKAQLATEDATRDQGLTPRSQDEP